MTYNSLNQNYIFSKISGTPNWADPCESCSPWAPGGRYGPLPCGVCGPCGKCSPCNPAACWAGSNSLNKPTCFPCDGPYDPYHQRPGIPLGSPKGDCCDSCRGDGWNHNRNRSGCGCKSKDNCRGTIDLCVPSANSCDGYEKICIKKDPCYKPLYLPPYIDPCENPWVKNLPFIIRTFGDYNNCA